MTLLELKQFFTERPALSVSKIGEEAGYKDGKYLRRAMSGEFGDELPKKLLDKISPILKKYGK